MTSPVRNSMKQTATVVRTGEGTLNPLNQPTPGVDTTRNVPCRAWEETETDIAGDGKAVLPNRAQGAGPSGRRRVG